MQGPGTFTWADGTSYHGQFNNGQMTGKGRCSNKILNERKRNPKLQRYESADGGVFEEGLYYPDGTDTSVSYEALFDGFTLKCVALLLLSFLILLFCRYRKPPPPAPSKGGKGKGGNKGR